MKTSPYDVSVLSELFSYDPETGALTWKPRTHDFFPTADARRQCLAWNARYAGKQVSAARSGSGYLSTTIMKKRTMVHRIAWCLHHNMSLDAGMVIDHINGDKTDNRICNLRLSTAAQNMQNAAKKAAGVRGAFFHKRTGKFQASIRLHLGTFETPEEAAAAYEAAAAKLHSEFYLPNGTRVNVTRVL